MKRRSVVRLLALFAVLLLCVFAADARTGGGGSYSGGGSSSSGGDGGGGEIIYLIFRLLFWLTFEYPLIGIPIDIIVIIAVVSYFRNSKKVSDAGAPVSLSVGTVSDGGAMRGGQKMEGLRRFDPNFSEVTFADFCYSLYGRVHNARGTGQLDQYAPYLSVPARTTLARRAQNLTFVEGVVIGSFEVGGLRGLDTPTVEVTVLFEANYTERMGAHTQSWYVREQWTFERKRDILSPPPDKAKADHCPRCGAALKTRTDGACDYCGVKITGGTFNWYAKTVALLTREERGPLLTSDVPERGTDFPTVVQPNFAEHRAAFVAEYPDFDWPQFEQRVRQVAVELQKAWSSRNWEAARVYETEPLFQMHRYWIDSYKREKLRNLVDGHTVTRVEPARITRDAFYVAITVRIFAEGRDYTVDEKDKVVAGSKTNLRRWSEYWTFIRSRATAAPGGTVACPNCGASVQAGSTGICPYCGGKMTTGSFEWILSRIEQDEAYRS